jgi:uncharacterized protein YjbI with pentapeptide repeats
MTLAAVLVLGGTPIVAEDKLVSRDTDLSVRDIVSTLFKAKPGDAIDFAGRNLAYLDLAGIDFKRANLAGSDLYGVDFTGSNLRGSDLAGARLDRAVLIKADLSGANLMGATLLRPTIYTDLSNNPADAPRFSGANLANARVMANLSGADFHGSDLSGADFRPQEAREKGGGVTSLAGSVLEGCDFERTIMRGTNLQGARLSFAHFTRADMAGANLSHTDLSRADFSGANLTNVDLTGADLDGARLLGVKGLETVKGLATAHNFETTIR